MKPGQPYIGEGGCGQGVISGGGRARAGPLQQCDRHLRNPLEEICREIVVAPAQSRAARAQLGAPLVCLVGRYEMVCAQDGVVGMHSFAEELELTKLPPR